MARVFISYRRCESRDLVYRLRDHLLPHCDQVFVDEYSIPLGTDFSLVLDAAVKRSDVLLAVIDRRWIEGGDSGLGLQDPNDYVRIELETALSADITIIPLLAHGASLPTSENMPSSLCAINHLQAVDVGPAAEFSVFVELLVNRMKEVANIYIRRTTESHAMRTAGLGPIDIRMVTKDGTLVTSEEGRSFEVYQEHCSYVSEWKATDDYATVLAIANLSRNQLALATEILTVDASKLQAGHSKSIESISRYQRLARDLTSISEQPAPCKKVAVKDGAPSKQTATGLEDFTSIEATFDPSITMSTEELGCPIVDFDTLPGTSGLFICFGDEATVIQHWQRGSSENIALASVGGVSCAVSGDGALAAVGNRFASISVYSLANRKQIKELQRDVSKDEKHRYEVLGITERAFDYETIRLSPCGEFIAAGRRISDREIDDVICPHTIDSMDEPVDVYSLSEGFLYSLPGYGASPEITFSANGDHLILGLECYDDDNFFVYETTTGNEVLRTYAQGFIRDILPLPNEQALVAIAGSDQAAIQTLSLNSGNPRMALSFEAIPDGHRYPCTDALALHPNGRYLVSAHNRGHLRLWDIEHGSLLRTWATNVSGHWIRRLRFSGDGEYLFATLQSLSGRIPKPVLKVLATRDLTNL